MAELRKAIVEFDKSEKKGRVYVNFLTELAERQDRLALIAKFKEDVEPFLTEDGFRVVIPYQFRSVSIQQIL